MWLLWQAFQPLPLHCSHCPWPAHNSCGTLIASAGLSSSCVQGVLRLLWSCFQSKCSQGPCPARIGSHACMHSLSVRGASCKAALTLQARPCCLLATCSWRSALLQVQASSMIFLYQGMHALSKVARGLPSRSPCTLLLPATAPVCNLTGDGHLGGRWHQQGDSGWRARRHQYCRQQDQGAGHTY